MIDTEKFKMQISRIDKKYLKEWSAFSFNQINSEKNYNRAQNLKKDYFIRIRNRQENTKNRKVVLINSLRILA